MEETKQDDRPIRERMKEAFASGEGTRISLTGADQEKQRAAIQEFLSSISERYQPGKDKLIVSYVQHTDGEETKHELVLSSDNTSAIRQVADMLIALKLPPPLIAGMILALK